MSTLFNRPLPTLNKWAVLTFAGMLITTSYGVKRFLNQPQQDTNHLTFPSAFLTKEPKETEILQPKPEIKSRPEPKPSSSAITLKPPIKQPEIKPKPPKSQVIKDKYPIDYEYLKKVGNHSLAKKYTSYLVLAPKGSEIGTEKAQKLVDIYKQNDNKKVGSYGYGYLSRNQLTANNAHHICKWALSYSEWTTLGTIGSSKKYFDFLGDICGREDMQKPKDGGYKD